MRLKHSAWSCLVLAAALAFQLVPFSPVVPAAYAADTLRPDVGKPLQAAKDLMGAQKYKEALAKIAETDAVANKTPYENFIIERMRGAAAAGAGDIDTSAKAFDAVIASGKLPADEQLKIMQSLAGSYYRIKEYTKAVTWADRYRKAGGTDPSVAVVLIQSYYLNGDYGTAAKELQAQFAADERAGRTPTEDQLQLLASCNLKQNDGAGYVATLEKLVANYPKKEYWTDLLARIQRKPGFSDRLSLDVYRLMLVTGTLKDASDYTDMAQLALQAGFPKEAQNVIQLGYNAKVLGTGNEADRQKRLKDLADKQAADDQKTLGADIAVKNGDSLINTGYNLVLNGQKDKGIAMIQQGLAMGGVKHPEDGKLHLGEAYLLAGKPEEASRTFKTVQGEDGTQDLGKLWAIQSRSASH